MFAIADPAEWWLDPVPESQIAFEQHDRYSSANSRWNAYLNQLCLHTVLAWLQTEYLPSATAGEAIANAAIWELVNGSRISLGNAQIVLIPSEAIDSSELEVPQEWIDIPSWAADYYLAVQMTEVGAIDFSDQPLPLQGVRVWGYTTHHQIKTAGRYDASDRTYCLDAHRLNRNLSTLWVTLQLCPTAQTRAIVDPLPELPATQGANLIERLSSPALCFPRLEVPFSLWGALLEREEWRQQLYQRRSQLNSSDSVERMRLRDWLQNRVSDGWRSLEERFGLSSSELVMRVRSSASPNSTDTVQTKELVLGSTPDAPSIVLVLHLSLEPDGRIAILVQLHPAAADALLPAEISLSLLSSTGETLQSAISQAEDNYIQLKRFRCAAGIQFSLEIVFGSHRDVEPFVV